MKNRIVSALLFILFGGLVILGPTVLFPVCEAHEMKMACYYTKQAEIGLGIIIVLLGIATAVIKNRDIRIGISFSQLLISILILLYPLKLIGLCKMSNMACRLRTLPSLFVTSVLLLIISAVNIWHLSKKGK